MRHEWLAIDASTSPITRAREVELARERFLQGGHAVPGVRAPIVESWRRSAAARIDPGRWTAPLEVDEQEARERFADHPLGRLAPVLRRSLAAIWGEDEHLVVVTDADGLLLSVDGTPTVRARAAENMGFVAGARWSEEAAGTNGIGIALAGGHPVQVFAGEHYTEQMRWWTCAAAPVHDPASGRLLGAVNLTGPMETVHPHSLALVMATKLTLETQLSSGRMELDGVASTISTPEARASRLPVLTLVGLGRDRAHATLDGRELALSQRHSEILMLLASHRSGMTGEELAIALYGDEGKPVTARAEISRLRRLLGPCIRTEPYRLEAEIRSDIATVQKLLRNGEVSEAAALYRGPVLPRSEAPGVTDLRIELEGWTRRAVMASDDIEALWAWLTTPSGEDDMQAWKRFLSSVPHDDGRRGLAAARLERLRSLFGVPNGTGRQSSAAAVA